MYYIYYITDRYRFILFQDLGNQPCHTVGQRGHEVVIEVQDDSGLDHPHRRQDLSCFCAHGARPWGSAGKIHVVHWWYETYGETSWKTIMVILVVQILSYRVILLYIILEYLIDPSDLDSLDNLDIRGGSCISEAENMIFVGMHWEGTLQLDHTYHGTELVVRDVGMQLALLALEC